MSTSSTIAAEYLGQLIEAGAFGSMVDEYRDRMRVQRWETYAELRATDGEEAAEADLDDSIVRSGFTVPQRHVIAGSIDPIARALQVWAQSHDALYTLTLADIPVHPRDIGSSAQLFLLNVVNLRRNFSNEPLPHLQAIGVWNDPENPGNNQAMLVLRPWGVHDPDCYFFVMVTGDGTLSSFKLGLRTTYEEVVGRDFGAPLTQCNIRPQVEPVTLDSEMGPGASLYVIDKLPQLAQCLLDAAGNL